MINEFEKLIDYYNSKIGNEIVESFLNNTFSSTNLVQILKDYGYKKVEKELLILKEVFIIGNSYEKIINKDDFLLFLTNKLENIDVDKLKKETYYGIIYELYLNDNNIFLNLYLN